MKQLRKTAYAEHPDGDFGDEMVDKHIYNIQMAAYDAHMLGKMRMFALGDSMTGYGMGSGSASFFGMMRMVGYDPDVAYNHGAYYDNQPQINDPALGGIAFPNGPQGWNFAAGGKNTEHMVNIQMGFVRQALAAGTLPLHFLISTFQNDQFWNGLSPETSCQRVIAVCDELIDKMGRRGILLGPWPHSQLAADATGKHYIEQRMREYAATKPGLIYVSILDFLKSGIAAEEANDNVNYKGWQIPAGQVGRASWDEIHAAPYAARIVGLALAPAFRILVRKYPPRVFEARAFSKTLNPLGNLFGSKGRLAGVGGTIVNVAGNVPANWTRTASNQLPAGMELIYDQSKGVILDPQLTGNPDYPLRLTPTGGTPTVDFQWACRISEFVDVPNGWSEVYGNGRWVNANGWGGVGLGNAGEGAPGMAPGTIISSYPGHGGGGGADYAMPFPLNEDLTWHGPLFYYQFGNRNLLMDVSGGFAAGIKPTGSLEIGRMGLFNSVIPANY